MQPLSFDYERPDLRYAHVRRGDERIAAQVHAALGDARSVLNVGAGTGSYEPDDRQVCALEPSAAMRRQRIALGRAPALAGLAQHLPFQTDSFDAVMAMVTVHHWPDLDAGLREMRRGARGPVVILTFDPAALDRFWGARMFPDLVEIERRRYPTLVRLGAGLGGVGTVEEVPIPADCTDGFQEAFFARPEAFLDPVVRRAQSAWGFLPPGREAILVENLRTALTSGAWDQEFHAWRQLHEWNGSLRLLRYGP